MSYMACAGDDSTTKPTSTTGSTSAGTGTTATSGAGGSSGTGTTSSSTTNPTTSTTSTSGAGGGGTTSSTIGSTGSTTSGGGTNPTTSGGGTTGSGGTGAGGTGAGGSSGACPAPTAASGLISDFATANVANQLTGGTDTWYSPGTAMVMDGAMHFTAPGTMFGQAVSTLIASKPGVKDCVDLTKYTSISFKISSPSNTSMLFEIVSKEVTNLATPDGSGYRAPFTVTPTLTTVTIMLSTLMPPSFGLGQMQSMMPGFNILKDASAIVFAEPMANKALDITVDDVTFQ